MIVQGVLLCSFIFLFIYSLKLMHNGYIVGLILAVGTLLSSIMVVFPELSGALAELLGVGRGADLLLYMSFAIGVVLFLHTSSKIHTQNKKITKIIRSIAIKDAIKK